MEGQGPRQLDTRFRLFTRKCQKVGRDVGAIRLLVPGHPEREAGLVVEGLLLPADRQEAIDRAVNRRVLHVRLDARAKLQSFAGDLLAAIMQR